MYNKIMPFGSEIMKENEVLEFKKNLSEFIQLLLWGEENDDSFFELKGRI